MKERFITLLETVKYPYERVNALDKKELVEIHKAIFNYSSQWYRERSNGCSSCTNQSEYERRKAICLSCTGCRVNGKVLTCGEFGKPTKGRYPTCGCLINIKARFKIFNCPRGKWDGNK
jgi:hypothetical protein